jgi:hypothetical protein
MIAIRQVEKSSIVAYEGEPQRQLIDNIGLLPPPLVRQPELSCFEQLPVRIYVGQYTNSADTWWPRRRRSWHSIGSLYCFNLGTFKTVHQFKPVLRNPHASHAMNAIVAAVHCTILHGGEMIWRSASGIR